MTSTKSKPILFKGAMIRALLEDKKFQTRRTIKPVGNDGGFVCVEERDGSWWPYRSHDGESFDDGNGCEVRLVPPYGEPGDHLWVKETTYIAPPNFGDKIYCNRVDDEGRPRLVAWSASINSEGRRCAADYWVKQTLSIFMPRWASRLTLEVTEVRVERLQEISEADAIAEGMLFHDGGGIGHSGWRHDVNHGFVYATAKEAYAVLWELINGKGSWAENPWVFVYGVKRVTEGTTS